MPASAAFMLAVAIACATIMGYAINRGATCMVAAVDEVVRQQRFGRFLALGEAALWVAGGIMVASAIGLMPQPAVRHALSVLTIAGGALLGFGAYVNKACVFGSVARFGSGEWHYAATPLGFLAGCVLILPWLPATMPVAPSQAPHIPAILGVALTAFAVWRGIGLLLAAHEVALSRHIWAPHQATSIIGLTFVVMLLTVGAWTYPEALAQLARGMTMNSAMRLILFAALLAGAVWGGRQLRGDRKGNWSFKAGTQCFAGGALMGAGSLLIPGGNDNLILMGLPLLQPYAWVALTAMAGVIALCLIVEDRVRSALDSAWRLH
ncbi:YeeE/YedE thiosulfate transporter family protein [Sphingobium subterraneum]|uniref:Toxin CptA n=1 Tax=Sphingobium subterraneum TaxID=627688 RepID=A0A841J1X4_9SPHN|nr:YeeE/YedE thiosulfate transporter family protein [Sphingobium subterraneum]MBB6125179.1 toxin CptA [Sphingobium subterraneum]